MLRAVDAKPEYNSPIGGIHSRQPYSKDYASFKILQARVSYHKSSTHNYARLPDTLSLKAAVPCNNHCCVRCCDSFFHFHCTIHTVITAFTRSRSPPFFCLCLYSSILMTGFDSDNLLVPITAMASHAIIVKI